MSVNQHIVNLDLPPEQRWEFLVDYKTEIDDLLQCYLNDFAGMELVFENILGVHQNNIVSDEYLKEIAFIASISKFSAEQVLIANLYYDIMKFYFGCSAFAFESEGTVFHARNLDWWTDNNLLSKHSKIFDFQRGGKTIFKTVGWVGFIGALSGIKPGEFTITLNAVLSEDQPEIAQPISFFIRDVLDKADSFQGAKHKLSDTTIACDCLLLLSGQNKDELVVIERTPSRSAIRSTNNGFIAVTNDYKQLENNLAGESELQSTSCGRYDRVRALLNQKLPSDFEDCLAVLQDEKVMMGITVQQMVFNNQTGMINLVKTEQNGSYS